MTEWLDEMFRQAKVEVKEQARREANEFLREQGGEHALSMVSEFTQHRTGWRQLPEGGRVPIIEPLNPTHWRWYCVCGAISGRKPTREAARADHERHVGEQ